MKNRIMAVLILLIFMFSIAAVSAADDTPVNSTDALSAGENNINDHDSSSTSEDEDSILSENGENLLDEDSTTHYGYWAWSTDLPTLNLTDLSDHGVTDIFLNYYAFERFNESVVESLALTAKEKGINVHIWAQIFKDSEHWTRPIDREGNVNNEAFDRKTAELEYYAGVKGIAGIHYDYLRFSGSAYYNNTGWQNPGGKEAITYFVKQSTEAIRKINPDLIISAAIMPEPDWLEDVYGVEYSEITKYFDVITPMVYRGNFRQDTAWVGEMTKFFIENSSGSTVWTGLQGYVDDDNPNKLLPEVQIRIDANTALDAGAEGVIIFKINRCENVDFNNLSVDEKQLESFEYLNYKTSSTYKTLNLENDFAFDESTDAEFIGGISIDRKKLTIDGNNHIIDAKNLAKPVFNITADNVTLKNIRFKNVAGNNESGAIYIAGANVEIINCSYITDADNPENNPQPSKDKKHEDTPQNNAEPQHKSESQQDMQIIAAATSPVSKDEIVAASTGDAVNNNKTANGNKTTNESSHAGSNDANIENAPFNYWYLIILIILALAALIIWRLH